MSTCTLADLRPGQTGVVDGFSVFDSMTFRIMQLGVLEETPLEVVRRAPFSDPIEIRVMNYSLSLRRDEANRIRIRVDDAG
ncbi:MAG: FeoA family protein [Xanthomonadales bacterium]|nr:FeoA family protein [Xanthomonadales bacterium]